MIPTWPSFIYFFNKGNIEVTDFLNIRIWCLCVHILFYVCVGIGFVCVYIYMRRVWKCVFAYDRVWLF